MLRNLVLLPDTSIGKSIHLRKETGESDWMMAAVSVYQRRRNHHHDRLFHQGVSVSSIIVTAGLLILFFLSVLSFLTPLPDHHSSFLNPLRRASNSQIRSNRLPLTPILVLYCHINYQSNAIYSLFRDLLLNV